MTTTAPPPLPAALDPAALRAQFHDAGIVILPGFFSPAQLSPLVAAIDAHAAELPATHSRKNFGKFETDVVAWHVREVPVFVALRDHPALVAATQALIGPDYQHGTQMVMYSRQGISQAWHQDSPPGDPRKFVLNRLVYVKDVTLDDGAVVCVPGSHRQGRLPPGGHQESLPGEQLLTPQAGTLIFMHSHCYHRVTPNQRPTPRLSLNFRVTPAGVPTGLDMVAIYRNGAYDFRTGEVKQ